MINLRKNIKGQFEVGTISQLERVIRKLGTTRFRGGQIAITEIFSDMDSELGALEQRRSETRALKQGMMQELLTGRTRLV